MPHMGWNSVRLQRSHPAFQGIPQDSYFYFVHSYYAAPDNQLGVAGITEYGVPFCSVYAQDNLIATQFHPEKSGRVGLRIYENFVNLATESQVAGNQRSDEIQNTSFVPLYERGVGGGC